MSHRYKHKEKQKEKSEEPAYVRAWRKELDKMVRAVPRKAFDDRIHRRMQDLKERIAEWERKQAEDSDVEYEL